MNASELQKLTDWLVDGARSAGPQLMTQACERLVQAGLPLWRVGVFVRTLHPDIFGRNFIWRPGAEVAVGNVDFDITNSPEFRSSPLAIVFGEGREVRHRTDDPESRRFPPIFLPTPFGGTYNRRIVFSFLEAWIAITVQPNTFSATSPFRE